MRRFFLATLLTGIVFGLHGQAPVITYPSGSLNYTVSVPVTPLSPQNTGGAVYASGQTWTFAGGLGVAGTTNGTGTSARFNHPIGLVTDASGNIYVADRLNHTIRKITSGGVVTTLAGSTTTGFVNGTGTAARFNQPNSVAVDASGNVYVADQLNHAIRKITPAGVVTTFAGNGTAGAVNGTGTGASFNNPFGVAVDGSGNVYVADQANRIIRKITPGGVVTTLAGSGAAGMVNGTGTSASFYMPLAVTVDQAGNVYVADSGNEVIRKITPAGVVTTLAGAGYQGSSNGTGTSASFSHPAGVSVDANGTVYVADEVNNLIRKVTAAGVVTTLSGNGAQGGVNGSGTSSSFYYPCGVAVDGKGSVFVADYNNNLIRKIATGGYFITPVLPTGLVFDELTGVISGTPSVITSPVTYTITANNSFGSGITTVTIGVSSASSNSLVDNDRNWVSSTSYDESGNVIAESKQFFDNNGKTTQAQVKNQTTGQVLASQTIYDQEGRPVIGTLSAPINSSVFGYKDKFVGNSSGGNYNSQNFEGDRDPVTGNYNKVNNPDPVSVGQQGTLGWYYSNSNTLEPYVGTTSYPYSRTSYYRDGSGQGKSNAGPGEAYRMGQGHETASAGLPVINELVNYLSIRNKFFTSSKVGEVPLGMQGKALQAVSVDADGMRAVSITDLAGKSLMSGRGDGSGYLTILNTLHLEAQLPVQYVFTINVSEAGKAPGSQVTDVASFNIRSNDNIKVYCISCGNTVVYQGPGDRCSLTGIPAGQTYRIESAFPFYVNASAAQNVLRYDMAGAQLQEPAGNTIGYFDLLAAAPVSITGTYKLYNMQLEQEVSGFTSGSTLQPGLYKVVSVLNGTVAGNAVDVSYSNKLSDISYNYYNQLGQLIASIPPMGVKELFSNGGAYNASTPIPYGTTYEYDTEGRLIAAVSSDAGRSEFIYRKDGKIRFSQNAVQQAAGSYSYINYDELGRAVESGEYQPGSITFTQAKTNSLLQEDVTATGGLTGGTRRDWAKTHYDLPDNGHGLLGLGYGQDAGFLNGAVSWAENADSKTWFNYDDHGRVVWVVKQITGLGTKTVDYSYNDQGNLVKSDYQKNTASERFVHYYTYDQDARLIKTETSRDDATKLQHAVYSYYVHGPLKRVELGNQLQGIDYVYTVQGALKSINHASGDPAKDPRQDGVSNGFAADAFALQLEYYPSDYVRTNSNISTVAADQVATGQKNYYGGLVNGLSWKSKKPSSAIAQYGASIENPAMYIYNYDPKYQYNKATWGTPNFTSNTFTASGLFAEKGISYNDNGNMTAIQRTNESGASIDNYNEYLYTAGTNKLQKVSNTSTGSIYATYLYDELGRVKSQQRTGDPFTYYFKYDMTNNVTGIYADNLFQQPKVTYVYDEGGNRIKRTDWTSGTAVSTYYMYDVSGNILAIYTGSSPVISEVPVYGSDRLGMYTVASDSYVYELKDNVGSVRAVIKRNKNGSGGIDVVTYADYYPYGKVARGGDPLLYRYDYQGAYAEKDGVTKFNNFDLRLYDGVIGRWLSTDPEGQFVSPYTGMGNNPVNGSDPTGGWWDEFDTDGKKISPLGGDKIDFYHQKDGNTKMVERYSGNSLIIRGGVNLIKGYTLRGEDISWRDITMEWWNGDGPTRSMIADLEDNYQQPGPFKSLRSSNSTFMNKVREQLVNSKRPLGRVSFDYSEINPFTAGFDGWEQMWGRTNISFYKLGNTNVFLMADSKSWESAGYRIVPSFERLPYMKTAGGNTYQTYIWTEPSYITGTLNAWYQKNK